MPPTKKQKTKQRTTKPAADTSNAAPCSSRSTRSRTRSASVAASAPPAPKRGTRRRNVNTQLHDGSLEADQEISQVWDGLDREQTQCWVSIPTLSKPACREDELGFIRPRDMAAFIQKGKYKALPDSPLWHVDQRPADALPFHFVEQDLREDAGPSHYVAVRPKGREAGTASKQLISASVQPSHSDLDKRSPVTLTQSGRASSSTAPLAQVSPPQPRSGGLEDMFLTSNNQPQDEDGAPLFFHHESDNEDRMRDGTPARSQPTQRPKIKNSPTYGDRIAQGLGGQRSRSSTPRAAPSRSSVAAKGQTGEQQISKKGKERIQQRGAVELGQQNRKATQGVDDDEPKRKRKGDVLKNLRSELNEDAFARSTGARHKEEYRNKLAAFAQARKKAQIERGESIDSSSEDVDSRQNKRRRLGNDKRATTVSSGSSSSSSSDDSDSDDSDSSSSSDDSKDFIVADDEVEYEKGFSPRDEEDVPSMQREAIPQVRAPSDGRWYDRGSDGLIHLAPVSDDVTGKPSGSVLAAHGLGGAAARKGLDEMCLDWVEWAAARVLLTWSSLSLQDRKRLERNRGALRSRMRSVEESVGSVAMRRQFKWYLTQYPKIEVEALFSDEVEEYGSLAKNGCGICHRKSQKAHFKVTFSGLRYNQETLGPLRTPSHDSGSEDGSHSSSSSSAESSTSSDRSDDNETWREQALDDRSRPVYTFFAGQQCAQRAAVMHKLHHWEWTTMQTLSRHDSIRFIRRLLWRTKRQGRGKDGRIGCGAWEVALAVNEMISPSGRCVWKGMHRGREGNRPKGSELERLRRRLKSLTEQAIEVNRAR